MACTQLNPRQVYLDSRTQKNLIQVPVEELDGLHKNKATRKDFDLPTGSVKPIYGVSGPQVSESLVSM